MPKNKDLKRLTRSRMQKTGESYTTARAQLVGRKNRSPRQQDAATLAGMSDAAVRDKTGYTWERWTRYLNALGAAEMSHRDIARHLKDNCEISGWWAQTVTVGYERIIGRREVGQSCAGTFQAGKSKTFGVPVARLYRAFSTARTRNRWLPNSLLDVRKKTPEKSMRSPGKTAPRLSSTSPPRAIRRARSRFSTADSQPSPT